MRPSPRELDDLESLLSSAYPGVGGFLGQADLAAVESSACLADGRPWPVPLTLEIGTGQAGATRAAGSLVLLDEEGTPVARVNVQETWPGRAGVMIAGPVTALRALERGSHPHLRRRPTPSDRSRPVLGVTVARPPFAHEIAQWRSTAEALGASLLLLPFTGADRPSPVDGDALVRICLDVAREDDVPGSSATEVVPVAAPFHGDAERDRLLTAMVAKAYGATHTFGPLDVPGPRWSPLLPETVTPQPVVRDLRTGTWRVDPDIPSECRGSESSEQIEDLLEQMLRRGGDIPEWVLGRAAAREVARARRPDGIGVTVLFSGLSGSGKSTLARALHEALLQRSNRSVTRLDGDVVRSMLSSELGFSREHRELNVRRIGFVAAEITGHGGIAICAPIAPYARVRAEVRRMVSRRGGFLLVHVATPLAVCEARDRKGLYAKARTGTIPEFTGISDPWEPPSDADLTIDTTVTSVDDAVERVLAVLRERRWLAVDDAGTHVGERSG